MIIVHFEVYLLEARGWLLHARFPRQERDNALTEAKELESTLGVRVKVVRETYYTDTNAFDEAEVYLSGPPAAKAGAKPGAAGGGRASAPRQGKTTGTAKTAPRKAAAATRYTPPPARPPASAGGLLLRVTVICAFAVAAALLLTQYGVPKVVLLLYDYDIRITPTAYGQLLFAVFVLVFLMTAVPLALHFLPRQATLSIGKPRFSWGSGGGASKTKSDKEMKRSLDKLVNRALATPTPEPVEPEPEAQEAASDWDGDGLPPLEPWPDSDLPEILPDPGPESEREAQAFDAISPMIMQFLGGAINTVRAVAPALDRYNKLAINLYMAGAIEALGEVRRLDDAARASLLKMALETLGTSGDMAMRFHDKLEDYMMEPRYLQVIVAGRNAMEAWLAGNEAAAHDGLSRTIKDWNKPTEKKASVMTVMFTDMVGSTDLTQAKGDEAAQEIVRKHNTIVRTALAQYQGKEVKHTGDGIMASFASAANAVEATVFIQRQVAAHNARLPNLSLHLRIGLNAGEPIQEEDDLFGATVQLAARVCAATASDQTLCTLGVKELSLGKGLTFKDAGTHTLKGFKERFPLWEVVWD
jgi:class 3 adenylate cyclase